MLIECLELILSFEGWSLITFAIRRDLRIFSIIIELEGIAIFVIIFITLAIDFCLEFIVFIDPVYHFSPSLPLVISIALNFPFQGRYYSCIYFPFPKLTLQLDF